MHAHICRHPWITNIDWFFFIFIVCAEIIYISSSETSSEPLPYQSTWSDYFPKVEPSSSEDEIQSYQHKFGSNSKTVNASDLPTPKQLAKKAFAERLKVIGLPNKQKCEEWGIKPFVPKMAKDEADGSKGKGKRTKG